MSLLDARTGQSRKSFSIPELIERAAYMRGLNELALCSAGSGHSGGTLSIMDIAAALYLHIARHDPQCPDWPGRDRIVWSANHKAPALYTALAVCGYFPERELMKLRMLETPFQGHPHWRDLPGVEMSGGSLGQGFSVAVGMALAAKQDHREHRVFVISTDGEQQEGSIWEAGMSAAQFRLDNLIAIVDLNGLQIDGPVAEVMNIEPLADKYRAFGWDVREVDGHDMAALVGALDQARNHHHGGKPVVILAHTVKGKGVSFMEHALAWHGKAPNRTELDLALREFRVETRFNVDAMLAYGREYQRNVEERLDAAQPAFSKDYWWNTAPDMRVEMQPTRKGFGAALARCGDDERLICLGADISDSIAISEFYKAHPHRRRRFISVGVAEQNATTIAAGLAREGKLPVFGTYGVFASARNLDQIRISICYANLNVLIAGAHGGISVGPDGATHQELEALFAMTGLPNMHVAVPCDILETERMTRTLLFDIVGPKYLRFAREATPVVTTERTPLQFGEANVYRFMGRRPRFIDAFDVCLATEYETHDDQLSIVACGPELAEALRAAWILREEFGVRSRVINMHTLKPLDRAALERAALETGAILTAEEHQVGGLGNLVAAALLRIQNQLSKPIRFDMIGVPDRFAESGQPWQLMKKYGLTAEHIAQKARQLLQLA